MLGTVDRFAKIDAAPQTAADNHTILLTARSEIRKLTRAVTKAADSPRMLLIVCSLFAGVLRVFVFAPREKPLASR